MDLSNVDTATLQKIAGGQSQGPDLSHIETATLQKIAANKSALNAQNAAIPTPAMAMGQPTSGNLQQASAATVANATPQAQSNAILGSQMLGNAVDKINAVGGGAQETLANSIKYGGGLIGDITGKQGITNAANKISDVLHPPSFVQQAQSEHPVLSGIGNAIGGTMAMGLTGAAAGAGAEATTAAGASAAMSDTAALAASNAAMGAATAGKGNRLLGAGVGLALTGAGKAIGGLIGKAVTSTTLPNALKDVVGDANAALKGQTSDQAAATSVSNMWKVAAKVRDSLYNEFKNVEGAVDAKGVSSAASNTATKLADVMTPGQKGAFNTIANQAANVGNINDLHELSKSITSMKSLFLKTGTAPDVMAAFKGLQTSAEDTLTANAEKLGVGDAIQSARNFNKQVIVPLQDFGADKVARGEAKIDGFLNKYIITPSAAKPEGSPQSLGNLLNAMDENGKQIVTGSLMKRVAASINVGADGLNPQKGINQVQQYINTYGDKLGPQGVDQLKGMQTILEQMSAKQSTAMKAFTGGGNKIKLAIGGGIGAAVGHVVGGPIGMAAGASLGAGLIEAPVIIGNMLDSELGQHALQWIGRTGGSTGGKMALDMIEHYGSASAGKLINRAVPK